MKIVEEMLQQNEIQEEERELVNFGLQQCFHMLCNWMLVIGIALFFQLEMWQGVLFYFSYSIVRVFAGGFHSSTRIGCYIYSIVFIAFSFWLYHQFTRDRGICCLLYAAAVILIMCCSPMDNPNKRLSIVEKVRFRKMLKKIIALYSMAFTGSIYLGWYKAYVLLLFAILFVGTMILAGLLQQRLSTE